MSVPRPLETPETPGLESPVGSTFPTYAVSLCSADPHRANTT